MLILYCQELHSCRELPYILPSLSQKLSLVREENEPRKIKQNIKSFIPRRETFFFKFCYKQKKREKRGKENSDEKGETAKFKPSK